MAPKYGLCRQRGFSTLKWYCCQGKLALRPLPASQGAAPQLEPVSRYYRQLT